jgi:hypothetical protein
LSFELTKSIDDNIQRPVTVVVAYVLREHARTQLPGAWKTNRSASLAWRPGRLAKLVVGVWKVMK